MLWSFVYLPVVLIYIYICYWEKNKKVGYISTTKVKGNNNLWLFHLMMMIPFDDNIFKTVHGVVLKAKKGKIKGKYKTRTSLMPIVNTCCYIAYLK